jgi:hypothetical protein
VVTARVAAVPAASPLPARAASPAAGAGGLTPLPRRVPQTSLAAELREECAPAEEDGCADEFTAERAASSLACFQRGTLKARDADAAEEPAVAEAAPTSSTSPADRS